MYNCPFCNKFYEKPSSGKQHSIRCRENPNKIPHVGTTGKKGIHNQYTKARSLGLPDPIITQETRNKFIANNRSRTMSPEARKKISQARIKYLEANPHKVPYKLNHSSKESYAERYFRTILSRYKLNFFQEYQINLYSIDFAFLEKRIALEIDGEQHYLDDKIICSDLKRDNHLLSIGWKTIRVRWSLYKKLVLPKRQEFITKLIESINNQ